MEEQKKRIITIAGQPGSGKSTTSHLVATELGYEHFSSGDLFRAIGKEMGIDVYQTNVAAENNKSIDELVDQRLRDIGSRQERVAIDSRMAWHWMPQSFKVYLDLDLLQAATRILAKIDPKRLEYEQIPNDPEEYAARLKQRLDSEARRYKAMYGVDPFDTGNYDLVINTAEHDAPEVAARIIAAYRAWLGPRNV